MSRDLTSVGGRGKKIYEKKGIKKMSKSLGVERRSRDEKEGGSTQIKRGKKEEINDR